MAHIYVPPSIPWYRRPANLLGIAVTLAVLIIMGAFLGGFIKPPGPPPPDQNAITITYTTENGAGASRAVVDSPLVIRVRIPWSTGSQETTLAGVALQLLDEENRPARFGTAPIADAFAMKPTFNVAEWEWRGSVPSNAGKYHARVQVSGLYNKERDGITELRTPALEAVPEEGAPLVSGYAFAQDSNLWLLSTDTRKQRRLTYFPEFYEYADKPQWSPDGSRIAFTYSPRAPEGALPYTEIWEMSPGGQPRVLVRHMAGESLLDPAWSPDGKYIYFTVDTSGLTDPNLGAGALGTSVHIERVELATGVREQWMPSAQMPSCAPGGSVAFLEYLPVPEDAEGVLTPPQRLVIATADGETRDVLVPENTYQLMYAPSVSPDGRWVVFSAVNVPPPDATPPAATPGGFGLDVARLLGLAPRTAQAHGLPWDLFIVPATGGTPTRLTTMDEDQPYPTWIDSTTIAFMGTTGLYKLNIEGTGVPAGNPAKVHEGAPHGGLTWHKP